MVGCANSVIENIASGQVVIDQTVDMQPGLPGMLEHPARVIACAPEPDAVYPLNAQFLRYFAKSGFATGLERLAFAQRLQPLVPEPERKTRTRWAGDIERVLELSRRLGVSLKDMVDHSPEQAGIAFGQRIPGGEEDG